MSLTLQPARASDADAVARVFTRSRRLLDFLPDLHSAEEDRGFIRDVVLATTAVTLALKDDQIVGFLSETPGWIEHLYVDPPAIGCGVGTRLLEAAKSRQDRLTLWTFAENVRALGFYARAGFMVVEETDGSGNEARRPDKRLFWSRQPSTR